MKIKPLTEEYLEEALESLAVVFPEDISEIRKAFTASLDRSKWNSFFKIQLPTTLEYVVGIVDGKVVGTHGLYSTESDENEALWGGWFHVHPDYRGKGYGSQLIDYTIKETKRRGFRFRRLWTTDCPSEARAHEMYERRSFKIIRTSPNSVLGKTIFYMEKDLQEETLKQLNSLI